MSRSRRGPLAGHKAAPPTSDDLAAALGSPLWGLACVLGDIAVRVTRQRATEHTGQTPETRRGAGSDPVSGREAAR